MAHNGLQFKDYRVEMLFWAKQNSPSEEKLVIRSGVHFFILLVLMGAILLNLDLQKRVFIILSKIVYT